MSDQSKKIQTYEGLFILNNAGKEEGIREMIEKLEKDIQKAGGKPVKVERMDKRPFARVARKVDSGYYVNIVFEMPSQNLAAFRSKLKLDDEIFRSMFFAAGRRGTAKERSARAPVN